MAAFNEAMTTTELMKIAADFNQQKISFSSEEKQELISLLKKRGEEELEYGQEVEHEGVRLVRRVTGALGVYFK